MTDLKERILNKMTSPTMATLATLTEDGTPWVRYVSVTADEDMTIRLAISANSRKAAHIEQNPEVHMTLGVNDPRVRGPLPSYLQIQGRAEITDDPETKKAIWCDFLEKRFSGPDDPDYKVCKITPYRIEYCSSSADEEPGVWEA
jgi:general stress protein 26